MRRSRKTLIVIEAQTHLASHVDRECLEKFLRTRIGRYIEPQWVPNGHGGTEPVHFKIVTHNYLERLKTDRVARARRIALDTFNQEK